MLKFHKEPLNQRDSMGRNCKVVSTGVFNFTVLTNKIISLKGNV